MKDVVFTNGISLEGNPTVNLTLRGVNVIKSQHGNVFCGEAATLNIAGEESTSSVTEARISTMDGDSIASSNIVLSKFAAHYTIYIDDVKKDDFSDAYLPNKLLEISGVYGRSDIFGIGKSIYVATFACFRCGDVQMKADFEPQFKQHAATCLNNRYTEHVSTVTFQKQVYTHTYDRTEAPNTALGHDYDAPIWAYSEEEGTLAANFTCSRCGDVHMEIDSTPQYKVFPATCTENQYSMYEVTVTFEGQDYTAAYGREEVPGTALGHSCGEPAWTWAEDHSNASATFTCDRCGNMQTVTDSAPVRTEVSPATAKKDQVVKYTATVTFEGKTYTDETENVTVPGTATGTQSGGSKKVCNWCGKRHKGISGAFVGAIHSFLYFWAHLFKLK